MRLRFEDMTHQLIACVLRRFGLSPPLDPHLERPMGVADVLLQIHALVIIARPRERVLELAEALSVVDRRVVNSALRRAGDLDDDVAAAIEAA